MRVAGAAAPVVEAGHGGSLGDVDAVDAAGSGAGRDGAGLEVADGGFGGFPEGFFDVFPNVRGGDGPRGGHRFGDGVCDVEGGAALPFADYAEPVGERSAGGVFPA